MAKASPSSMLVQTLEHAALVVVGEVLEVRSLGDGAYQAEFRVEQTIVGTASASHWIVWEERANARPPRLTTKDRVLLGLAPLVVTSGWRERIEALPGPADARLAIAGSAGAFLQRPSVGEVVLLDHFLALSVARRSGPDGVRHLLSLAAEAQPALARAAAERLKSTGFARLSMPVAELAIAAISRPAESGVPAAMLGWVEARKPVELVAPLDRALAAAGPAAALVRVRARLPGPFEARLAPLARDPRPTMRAAVAASTSDPELWAALATDPSGLVREAAVSRQPPGEAGVAILARTLDDPEPRVRVASARTLAARGDEAVQTLRRLGLEAGSPARETALAALTLIRSPAAAGAIAEIARDHGDANMRKLAELALTRQIGDVHPVDP